MESYFKTLVELSGNDETFRHALRNSAREELSAAQRHIETIMCEAKRRIRGIRAELKRRERNKW